MITNKILKFFVVTLALLPALTVTVLTISRQFTQPTHPAAKDSGTFVCTYKQYTDYCTFKDFFIKHIATVTLVYLLLPLIALDYPLYSIAIIMAIVGVAYLLHKRFKTYETPPTS